MGLERRGCVVRPWPLANWKREEPVDEAKPFKQRLNIGSRVTREGHARFWERPEVKFLRATRQTDKNSLRVYLFRLPPVSDNRWRRSRQSKGRRFGPTDNRTAMRLRYHWAKHRVSPVRASRTRAVELVASGTERRSSGLVDRTYYVSHITADEPVP